MAGGTPRTVSPQPEEMIALGEEMLKWLKEHPDTLHLSQWYSMEKHFLESQWETMIQRPEFIGYYEQAMRTVGLQYLNKNSNARDGISHRWQRVYFKDLRKSEDEDLKAQAELNKLSSNPVNEQHQKQIDSLLSQISMMQNQLRCQSDRNMANNSMSEDARSDCDTEE